MQITAGVLIGALILLGGPGPAAAQDCGWRWVNPMPPRIDILRLKHESRAFVGVGRAGVLIRSADGFEWQLVDAGVTADLFGIDWGAGSFVAVGDGVILKSTGGFEWTVAHSDPGATFLDVEFSASRFVAVGEGLDGHVVTSPLGENWQAVPVPWTDTTDSIAGSSSGFFAAVGPEIWFSPDGFDWQYRSAVPAATKLSTPGAGAKKLGFDLFELDRVDLAWAGDRLLWAGGSELWSGINGEKWELAAELSGCSEWQDWLTVIAGPGWAMASGISGCPSPFLDPIVSLTFSTDGGATFPEMWQTELGGFPAMARYGARWIAAGALGDLMTSANGVSWECVGGSCTSLACADDFVDLAVSEDGLVAAGGVGLCDGILKRRSGATMALSDDGAEWTIHPIVGDRFRGITFFDGEYLAVGDGWLARSPDGTQWQTEPSPDGAMLHAVEAGTGWVVAVGQNGALYVSADGHGWDSPYLYFNEDLDRVTWDGDHFVAAGHAGSILYSADAANWSFGLASTDVDLKGEAAGPEGKIVVGENGVILGSDDARVWLPRRSGVEGSLNDVAYGDGRYVVVGWEAAPDGTHPAIVLASAHGVQWTRLPAPGQALRRVLRTDSGWVAVGGDRTLLQTPCLGTLLEVDQELLQVEFGSTAALELGLSAPVTVATEIAVLSSAPQAVQVPDAVTVVPGSDVVTVPVTGSTVAADVVLSFTLPDELGGGVLTSSATVQPPLWTPRRPGGRRSP